MPADYEWLELAQNEIIALYITSLKLTNCHCRWPCFGRGVGL